MPWRLRFRNRDDLVFLHDDGSMKSVPAWLVAYLVHGWSFPGEVREAGKSIVFTHRGRACRVRKDLVDELCGTRAREGGDVAHA